MICKAVDRIVTCLTLAFLVVGPVSAQESDRLELFVLDVEKMDVKSIVAEPAAGHSHCGSPSFSGDGRRILFDATPGRSWSETRIYATDFPTKETSEFTDLGPGNCPSWSPDGKQIAFLLNANAVPNAEPGIWLMNANGTGRSRLAEGEVPKWSPDGNQILTVSFANPSVLSLIDVKNGNRRPLALADHEFISTPSWAGDGRTLISAIRGKGPIAIALLDVTESGDANVKQILWTRGQGSPVSPMFPVYHARTTRCVFVGWEKAGLSLYHFDSERAVPKQIEKDGVLDSRLASLAISPDGRYVLFCSNRAPRNKPRE